MSDIIRWWCSTPRTRAWSRWKWYDPSPTSSAPQQMKPSSSNTYPIYIFRSLLSTCSSVSTFRLPPNDRGIITAHIFFPVYSFHLSRYLEKPKRDDEASDLITIPNLMEKKVSSLTILCLYIPASFSPEWTHRISIKLSAPLVTWADESTGSLCLLGQPPVDQLINKSNKGKQTHSVTPYVLLGANGTWTENGCCPDLLCQEPYRSEKVCILRANANIQLPTY